MRLDGESSFVLLLQYDQLRFADVTSEHVDLTVHRPRQFLLDRLRLAVAERHLSAEPRVCLQDLSGGRQLHANLDARRTRLLHAHRTRRPGRSLGAERVRLFAVCSVGERRLEEDVGRRSLTGSAWRRRFRLVDCVVVVELNASPIHLGTDEVLIQQTSLFPCSFPPKVVDRPALDERLNVDLV